MPARWFHRAPKAPNAILTGSRRRSALRRRPAIESLEGRQLLSTFTVSNELDSGTGSLRQAIINSNSNAATSTSPNIISFSGLSNLVQIQLQSPLPWITQPVIIDGTTANSYNGTHPFVQLIGNYAGSGALGLDITASGTQVKALAIDGFNAGGVLINDASNVVLDHDYVGLNPNANATGQDVNGNAIYEGNGTYGVLINSDAFGSSTGDVLSNDIVSANSYNGIILSGASTTKNLVSGTIIGSDNTGAAVVDDPGNALGNGQHGGGGSGVVINGGASYNTIGGTTAAARDVILGNKSYGVLITDGNTTHNVVEGDAIGTDITGTHGNDGSGRSYGNGSSGVAIVFGASFNVVSGTPTAPEVISDNAGDGVLISGSMTSSNQVSGVDIGTDQTGEVALPNAGDGVAVTSAATDNFIGLGGSPANVISGNTGNGVSLTGFDTDQNFVENNLIGIDAKGTTGLGNGQDGVLVNGQASSNFIGYAASGDNNVISGNGTWGVFISDSGTNGNTVANDIIGLTAAGNAPVPNNNNGVDIVNGAQSNTIGGTTTAARNVISGNLHEGVLIGYAGTANNVVEGNFIGTDPTGKALLGISSQLDGVYIGLGAGSNTIGGQNPTGAINTAAWNVISGNQNSGILVTDSGTTGTVICGNFIGTDVTGTAILSNFGNGITIAAGTSNTTVGAQTSGLGNLNVISGNAGDGLSITSSSGNNISFDYFGVDINNQKALGNAGNGVSIHSASGNRVNINVIENNGGYGILTDTGASNNAWYYDSIYGNTKGGIATPTDASPQSVPQLISDSVAGGQTTITGVIFASPQHSAPMILQFYVSPASTTAASIQGLTFVGQANVTSDANGNALFTATLPKVFAPGQILTATLDYNVSNTSVFSNALAVPVLAPPTLAAIPSQTIAPGQRFVMNLQGSDPAGLPLSYTATIDSLAYHLKSTLGLYESGGSFHTNLLGGGEQWVQGNGGGWYYILPSGALYAWSGSGLTGTLVAQLDPSYNTNPSLLVNAQPGQGQATASTFGSSLTIIPNSGFNGLLFVTVTANDGYNTASQSFQLTVAAPTLTQIPSVTSETPASGATGVAVNAPLTATFNEAVQPSTISFTLAGPGNAAVPASLSYNASTNTATLTPLSSLAAGTTYTATVSGAKDTAGDPMSGPLSWTFTTSATYGPGPFSIWSAAATPQMADAADGNSVEVGVRFTPSISGTITGLRFYKGALNTGTHVADLWSSAGKLLATATFTNETASGWQQVNFSQPVAVTAGTTYVASYHTSVGEYSANKSYFATAYVSGPLQVPANGGVFAYGAAGTFPTNSYAGSNYWVDVVLSSQTAKATPTITWANPASIVYGTALGSAQLDATASVPGTFAYTPAAGTVLKAGTDTLSVTFTPTDTTDYATATATATIVVTRATPTITWANPASIVSGTALSSAQLNATANVPGTFAYTPAAGTVPPAGTDKLSVTFTPTDTTDYATASATVSINVVSSTSTTYSLWSNNPTPQTADAADGSAVELGVRFTPSISGTITGLRFYKGALNTGAHIADLWSSTGALLATATFTNETTSGWQQVNFSTPVAVTAGTTYVASYHTNVGEYALNKSYFATAYSSGPLQVPANGGVYAYGAAGTFPRNSYAGSNYWVDVVLAPTSSTSLATTSTATGPGAGALAIGTLNFGDDTTGPASGVSPSASDAVVRIRWRQ